MSYFAVADKIIDQVDTAASGLVRLQNGYVFVSNNSTVPTMPIDLSVLVPAPDIQRGIDAAAPGETVYVDSGTFEQDVNLNKAGLKLIGMGVGSTTISGVEGGDVATVRVNASNVEVAHFTITREGNNPADWNNPGLNSAGIAIIGTSLTGMLVHDNYIYGNRTGIDVNNSSGHAIRNNVIETNHTGLIFRNQTNNLLVTENSIIDNRTVGVLFLDASGGSNSPLQQALSSTFSNNDITTWVRTPTSRRTRAGALMVSKE